MPDGPVDENPGEINPITVRVGNLNDQMSTSYLDYAYSVIVGRAIPDIRDGLKPVQRRILYAMYQAGYTYNKPTKKCAAIVGDVLGKYHPHGDSSVYDALVRMAQDFTLRYPLIQGQGNFGSIDGDPPAAYRYTEARLARIADEVLSDIEKDTVSFMPNFDESLQEPKYLPSKIPNLLINGASGIAVGMRTNMLPYNLHEIANSIVAVIDKPDMYPEELTTYIKGPDFPTRGIIMGRSGIRHVITTGRGKIVVRGRVEIDDSKKRTRLIITEIPYLVNKSTLVEQIGELVSDKKIVGITDLTDESNREGIRIVIELGRDTDPNAIKHQLFKMTTLQSSYGVINLFLVNNGKQPAVMNILQMIKSFIEIREDVIKKRTEFDLKNAQKRLHIIEGLVIAINNIDAIIIIIKKSNDVADARASLMKSYKLSEIQASEILEMPLRRLTNLQFQKLKDEKAQILKDIKDLESILADHARRLQIVKSEMIDIDKQFGDDRKTEIFEIEDETYKDDDIIKTIPEESCVVMLTENQYIKRLSLKAYQSQHRGGKGKKGMTIREEDIIRDLFVVSSHDKVLMFTKKGRVYSANAYEIPMSARAAKGKALINFVGLKPDEQIVHMIPVSDFEAPCNLVFVTKKGLIKSTILHEFRNVRKTGIAAMKLREDDELIDVKLSEDEENYILIATKNGYAIKFPEISLRSLSRIALGVRGIHLRDGDAVVDLVVGSNDTDIITITHRGYGKRSKLELYRETRRGGKGVINIKFHYENDSVNSVKTVSNEDLLIATSSGMVIRIPSKNLRSLSRTAKGVKLIDLKETDSVSSVALCEVELEIGDSTESLEENGVNKTEVAAEDDVSGEEEGTDEEDDHTTIDKDEELDEDEDISDDIDDDTDDK
jgi:DNA gyrase subunit A